MSIKNISIITTIIISTFTVIGCNALLGKSSNQSITDVANHEPVSESHSIHTLAKGEDLESVLASASGTVLVDFYADWCGPCKKQARVLHEMDEFAGQVGAQIIKVNTETHPKIARAYGVRSLPTLVVFRDGQVVTQKTGLTARADLETMLR